MTVNHVMTHHLCSSIVSLQGNMYRLLFCMWPSWSELPLVTHYICKIFLWRTYCTVHATDAWIQHKQILTKWNIFTCKHELRNIWLDMQTCEERKGTLALVYFLLKFTQLGVHPLIEENSLNHLRSHSFIHTQSRCSNIILTCKTLQVGIRFRSHCDFHVFWESNKKAEI